MASDLTSRLGGARSSLAFKAPVRCATTANITLSGFQTIDGITPASSDTNLRILVKDQTNGVENGIYEMASGTWSRTRDFDGSDDLVKGTRIYVANGTANADTAWVVATADPITIGTTSLSFTEPSDEASASASAAAASASAAATSATTASTQATNAATSASTASTQATNAATSASAAATSASNASTSASAASTSASAASTSASAAASSASAASSSASAAATSATNAAAAAGFTWTFDSSTTMSAPSTGGIRFNNATLASVTAIAVSAQTADSGNPNVLARLVARDDSTDDDKGHILYRVGTSTWVEYKVTALTDNTTWVQFTVEHVGGSGSISNGNTLIDSFSRTGNKGIDGAGSGDVTAASSFGTDNVVIRADGTGKGVQSSAVSISDNADLTAYDATNDGNPVFAYGASATERLRIVPTYDTGAQTIDYVLFTTDVASASADKGLFRFSPDGAAVLDIDDGGINFAASMGISIAGTDILTDSAGTATLSNIDALDATTEATIEAAIDTLANLTSIQGRTVTLADAGANAIFGWDDTAGAYENLTAAEVKGVVGIPTSTTDNGLPRFDGTSGNLQTTGITINDSNVVEGAKVTATGGTTARTLEAHFADHVSVLDFGAVGDYATDDTAAIQAAIDSGATVIYFPGDKTYKVTSTITMTGLGLGTVGKPAVRLFGDAPGSNGLGSSKIYWGGSANGTIFELKSCQSCVIEGLAFQGIYGGLESNPGIGVSFTGLNATGPTHWNIVRDCSISAINGTPGYALYIGSSTDDDIADNMFENILIANVKTAIYQEGTQTVHNPLFKIMALDFSVKGAVFVEGDARMDKCSFFGTSAATADVEIQTGVLWVTARDAYHEILNGYSSVAYSFPSGARAYGTTLDNCRVLWDRASGTVVNYLHRGPLHIEGCSFDGTGTGTITVNNGAATDQEFVFDGNYLATNITKAFSGSIKRTVSGPVEVVGALRPSASDGGALGSASLMWSDLFLASGGIINFNAGDVTLTHSADALTFQGAANGYLFSHALLPQASDGAALGSTANMWSDLFLASGGVINWNNGDVTATHSANTLAFAGASSGYTFDALTTITAANANALAVGANGTTNPVLKVDSATASVATGLSITGAAVGSRAAVAAISSGVNEGLSIDAKGSGTIRLGATSTGAVEFSRNAVPTASDGVALGTASLMWSDLFLASGGVLNFNNGDVTLTHSADALTFQGAANGYLFSHLLVPQISDGAALGSTANMWSDLFLASGAVVNFNNGDVTMTHSANALTITGGVTALDASSTVGGAVIKTAGTETIWIPAGAMVAKATNGAGSSTYDSGSNDVSIYTLDFDTTTQEYAHTPPIGMPKSWNEGTVTAVFYWTNTGGASTETVRWSIAGAAISDDDGLNTTFGTAQTVDDTWLAQNDLHITSATSAITIGGTPAENDLVIFEITRVVASDNMAGDARLIGVKILITTNASTDA